MTARSKAYRLIARTATAGAGRFVRSGRKVDVSQIPDANKKKRAWFHAASAGELESIWTLIEAWLESSEREAIITIFSHSAENALQKLSGQSFAGKVVAFGFSPLEGHWGGMLRKVKPSVFVTSKYEAWPELWMSLAELRIPLAIVGARASRSLKVAKSFLKSVGSPLPRLAFLPARETESAELIKLFPETLVRGCGDPRWDRVSTRARNGSARGRELLERYQVLDRPWGILGQVWQEDLEAWGKLLSQVGSRLFIVPHRVDADSIAEIEGILIRARLTPVRSSRNESVSGANKTACILVDEMGILPELYAQSDWTFIGGGFRNGVHSTIEPALHGIPIACGPIGTEKFPEIDQLRSSGQLRVVKTPEEIESWVKSFDRENNANKSKWLEEARGRLGATGRILELLLESC